MAHNAAVNVDDNLDTKAYIKLLDTVENEIHTSQNWVRYTMNGFVIAVGTYIKALTKKSKAFSKKLGKITVGAGGTACKVPLANDYIDKVIAKGRIGVKRKTARY